jgi:hypothetical protein
MRGDPDKSSRRTLFSVAGVDCFVTRFAWLSGPLFFFLGALIALVQRPQRSIATILSSGAIYGLVLFLSNMLHSAGHVIAGRIAGAPNGAVIITAAFHINYHRCKPGICSRWIHIGRSGGGPLANLLLGCVALALRSTSEWMWLDFAAKANLIVGMWLLLPIPSLDGWVIWGELTGFRRRR